jgi:DNA-binding transcriptional LysR family regulator
MHQIRYFLAVSETLNLTRAAERCNVAQPALTRAIKSLEGELGGELLRRERVFPHLTELGERMLPMLRQCYEAALTAKTVAASIRNGDIAPLSLAISHTLALDRFTPALRELSRAIPGLEINLRRGSDSEVGELLRSGSAELAIAGALPKAWPRLEEFPLFEEPFGLVVSRSHGLAGRAKAEIKDLTSEKLLISAGCEVFEELKALLAANGIVAITHQLATQEDVLTLLKVDLGVAIVPVGAAQENALYWIPLEQLNLVHKVSVYSIAGRHRPIASASTQERSDAERLIHDGA